MKAFKALNRDLTCRFQLGEVHSVKGNPVLYKRGFHFCKDYVERSKGYCLLGGSI